MVRSFSCKSLGADKVKTRVVMSIVEMGCCIDCVIMLLSREVVMDAL